MQSFFWSPNTYLKPRGHGFKALYLGVLQCRVGGNGAEHLQDLVEPSLECVKLSENVHLTEVKLPLVGRLLQLLFGLVETPLVLLEDTFEGHHVQETVQYVNNSQSSIFHATRSITHLIEVDSSFDFVCHGSLRLVPD